MATDSFTNTNGTYIGDHSAGGNTWSGCGQGAASGEIQSNTVCADASDYFSVSARATNSTVDFSQIVFKAGSYESESKAVHVRSTSSSNGYKLVAYVVDAGNITMFALFRHETFLTIADGLSISTASDHTVALKATTSGGNVELRAWVDGNPLTFNDTSSVDDTNSQVFTDLAADGPITAAGNPGFTCAFFGTISAANSAFDDWTDVESSSANITGTGALTASAATVAGTGDQHTPVAITGSGTLTVSAVTVSGAGTHGAVNTNSPALQVSVATVSGTGTIGTNEPQSVTGTGDLSASTEQVAGTGVRGVYDQGGEVALVNQTPAVSGTGTVESPNGAVTGSGALAVTAVTVSAAGVKGVTGSGALTVSAGTISGTYTPQSITGTGTLSSQTPAIAGTNIVPTGHNGAGSRHFTIGLGLGL